MIFRVEVHDQQINTQSLPTGQLVNKNTKLEKMKEIFWSGDEEQCWKFRNVPLVMVMGLRADLKGKTPWCSCLLMQLLKSSVTSNFAKCTSYSPWGKDVYFYKTIVCQHMHPQTYLYILQNIFRNHMSYYNAAKPK